MLDPNYMLHISEPAEDIAEQLHNSIIKRIIDRMMLRIGRGEDYLLTATDKWQIQTLQEAGILLEDIQAEIARKTRLQEQEIKEAMEEAGVKAIEYDNKVYEDVGLSPKPLEQSPSLIRIMQRNYLATMGLLNNFTRTIAEESQKAFISAMDIAYNHVITGSLSYTEAVKEAVNSIVSYGVEIKYESGHTDTIETATLRCVRTGVSQASAQIGLARMDEMGVDKVLISSHLGARPTHQVWQGKVFTKEQLYSTDEGMPAYGTVTGLCGANCRHNISPYIEGMSNPFEHFDSKENLEMYEKEQRQRLLERRIRDTKREVLGLKEAMDKCQDEYAKSELESLYMRKSSLLSKQNQAYNDYCETNGMKKLNDRISIARWDRKQAAAARGAAKKWENAHRSNAKITNIKNYANDNLKKIDVKGIMDDYEKQIKELTEEKKNVTLKALMGDTSAIETGKDVERRLREIKEKYEEFKKSHNSEISELLKEELEKADNVKMDAYKHISKSSEITQQLHNIGIKDVTERISVLNDELMIQNVNQLTDLEKKFGAIKNTEVVLTINQKTKSVAHVKTTNRTPGLQELSLSGYHFKRKVNDVIEDQMGQIERKFKMPALKEKCSVYSITHEYGHLFENSMINEKYYKLPKEQQWEFMRDGLKYRLWKDGQAGDFWREIIGIAKELSGDELFLSYDYMSEYGQSNVYEAFAEVFANSQLGKPNIMGDAMNIWLERKGYK